MGTHGDTASGSDDAGGDALAALSELALRHGTQSLLEVPGPVQSFVLTDGPDGRKLQRPVADSLEGQVASGRWLLSQDTTSSRAAQVWDGYLTVDGERTDAVFVAVHERGAPTSVVTAQRYRIARSLRGRRPRLVGGPVAAGSSGPLLTAAADGGQAESLPEPPPSAPPPGPTGFVPPL